MIRIMKASAGSGKTFNLARKYITLLLGKQDRAAYRHILAVTFTNKATDEMKNRILKELHILAGDPASSGYLKWFVPDLFPPEEMEDVDPEDIVKELPGSPGRRITLESLRECAREMLCNILHDYSAFSVSTIDRFFQQTLKAFSREIGQFSSYQIELDKRALIEESVERMLDSLTEDSPELLGWLTDCAREQVESGARFNLDQRLADMAARLKSDAFRDVAESGNIDAAEVYSYPNLQKIRNICGEIISGFTQKVRSSAENALSAMKRCGLEASDFYRSFPKVLSLYAGTGKNDVITAPATFLARGSDSDLWFTKSARKANLEKARGLGTCFEDFCSLFGEEFRIYNTALLISDQLYELGVSADIDREFEAVLKERNVLSIDDSNLILRNIIDGSDAPFVYEKTGVRYENFLLDEFQDTSVIQWENFRPLLENSNAQNFENLIVGDVKQSIYRWRGSQWKLLQESLEKELSPCRTTVLDTNFRSRKNIVEFNNSFFTYASEALDEAYGDGSRVVSDIYSDVVQKAADSSDDPGTVEVTFCAKGAQEQLVLDTVTRLVEAGAAYGDIAVLVRNNSSGASVAGYLLNSSVPVITDDSLKVKSSSYVRKLVSLMSYIDNPDDGIGSYLAGSMNVEQTDGSRSLPDLCEALTRLVRSGDEQGFDAEATYIQSFMDCVLEYSSMNGNSLHGFLEYWNGADPCVSSPSAADAVRIITVHKSKGLDFRYVIFPFAETVRLFRPSDVWCCPDFSGTPLEAAGKGIFDVTLSEKSRETVFEEDFRHEKLMQYIDNINIFYVALTRAVRGMFIISEAPSAKFVTSLENENPDFSDMSRVLYSYLYMHGTGAGFRKIPREDNEDEPVAYRLGELSAEKSERSCGTLSALLPSGYPSFILNPGTDDAAVPGTRLVLSSDNADYFSSDGKTGLYSSGRMRGIVLHRILSEVVTADDLGKAVGNAVASGFLDDSEAGEAMAFLSGRIASAASEGWFSPEGRRIFNETSLIDCDGNVYRPDRVVVSNDGKVTVIDYKFGAEENRYHRQILHYADIWRRRGYSDVSACLWYLMEDKIIHV